MAAIIDHLVVDGLDEMDHQSTTDWLVGWCESQSVNQQSYVGELFVGTYLNCTDV